MMTPANIKSIGKIDYYACWEQMKQFTESRDSSTPDELWLVEHDPVFTLGLAGKEEHILIKEHSIPIIRSDRGGQVTYHGPQQIVIYILIDIKRLEFSIRELVTRIENGVISYLAELGIVANGDRDAPGVYVAGKKIASLGLKIRKGCSYHGLSFNFNLDKTPFSYINPCGYAGLQVVNLSELISGDVELNFATSAQRLAECLNRQIYT
ncbi:MAG: lipoyl(octanoyl) transferase LipB [Burkholderiales bacterium]|jgi:lipoyl(octanoyl) transferase|nr:lipoyl(octanoyl) transferase LipB [Burkholderiales bacterium]MBP9768024.1 lipoyl(octanoyl) transferase LipB [Burkholderiales bacterium]